MVALISSSVYSSLKQKIVEPPGDININTVFKKDIEDVIKQISEPEHQALTGLIEYISTYITTQKKGKLAKKHRKRIEELLEAVRVSPETVSEQIETTIRLIEQDNLEEELDGQCHRYSKFSASNPAQYIRYHSRDNIYLLEFDNESQRHKSLSESINILKTMLSHKIGKRISEIVGWKQIQYESNKIILYRHPTTGDVLYDINHSIQLTTRDDQECARKKYEKYKSNICDMSFRDNDHGGFYVKEFIPQDVFYKIVLHSTNEFSVRFKDELSVVLDRLTKEGILVVDDNVITAHIPQPVDHFLQIDPQTHEYTQTWNNPVITEAVMKMWKDARTISWGKFHKQHVMYFSILSLTDPLGRNRILCHPGYSYDLICQRIPSLRNDYKCNVYIIGVKYVRSQKDEKEFHKILHEKFPEFVVNHKSRQELYVFDQEILREFLAYSVADATPQGFEVMDEDVQKVLDDYFGDTDQQLQLDIIQRATVHIKDIQNEYQKDVALRLIDMTTEFVRLRTLVDMDESSRRLQLIASMPTDRLSYIDKILK